MNTQLKHCVAGITKAPSMIKKVRGVVLSGVTSPTLGPVVDYLESHTLRSWRDRLIDKAAKQLQRASQQPGYLSDDRLQDHKLEQLNIAVEVLRK